MEEPALVGDNMFDDSKVNRGRKIYNLLSSRNREGMNVHHLDSEFEDHSSLKLVPKVLECVHIYDRYSAMRGMPPRFFLSSGEDQG